MNRRHLILGIAALGGIAAGGALLATYPAEAALPPVTVWKSPTCGCCAAWVEHMRGAGFAVTVHEVEAINPIKAAQGVTPELASCHTAAVGAYTLEGHVPADAVKRLLAEKPKARGLAVPGMPQGSPGMETGVTEPYEILLFGNGEPTVFERR
ncbi:MAG TPA: DUF411 domain-containing protein [Azospirillaceae bacterium]|nr:DUF411 domain-containing protein [Azospirillaceae bacterium]